MPAFKKRDAFEADLAKALAGAGQDAYADTLDELGDPPQQGKLNDAFWAGLDEKYRTAIEGILAAAVLAYLGQRESAASIDGIDWSGIQQRAAEWARTYSYELVGGIDDTSRATLQDLLGRFLDGKLSQDELTAKIGDVFGPSRAANIAQTEITRAATMGENEFEKELNEMGLRTEATWETFGDACEEICAPLQGKVRGDGWQDGPPDDSHPRCDCDITVSVVEE